MQIYTCKFIYSFQCNVPFSTCLLTGKEVNGVISRLPICSSSNVLTFGKLENMKKYLIISNKNWIYK